MLCRSLPRPLTTPKATVLTRPQLALQVPDRIIYAGTEHINGSLYANQSFTSYLRREKGYQVPNSKPKMTTRKLKPNIYPPP